MIEGEDLPVALVKITYTKKPYLFTSFRSIWVTLTLAGEASSHQSIMSRYHCQNPEQAGDPLEGCSEPFRNIHPMACFCLERERSPSLAGQQSDLRGTKPNAEKEGKERSRGNTGQHLRLSGTTWAFKRTFTCREKLESGWFRLNSVFILCGRRVLKAGGFCNASDMACMKIPFSSLNFYSTLVKIFLKTSLTFFLILCLF